MNIRCGNCTKDMHALVMNRAELRCEHCGAFHASLYRVLVESIGYRPLVMEPPQGQALVNGNGLVEHTSEVMQ